jgi:hypothetical protein
LCSITPPPPPQEKSCCLWNVGRHYTAG